MRTGAPDFGDGRPIGYEFTMVPSEEADGVDQKQQITVTYAGLPEHGVLDSVRRIKTPVSNATGRTSRYPDPNLTRKNSKLTHCNTEQVALASYINPKRGKQEWDRMTAYPADKVSVLIANVYNGPGAADSKDSKEWTTVIKNATEHGKTVIGYVRTGYLGLANLSKKFGDKPFVTELGSAESVDWIAQIQEQVETWYRYVVACF